MQTQSPVSLRDLTSEQFESIYKADRFTVAVLASRMRYVVRHMCSGLLTNAFSLILRDWYDFSGTISGPPELDYPMSTVSDSLLLFMGTMPEAVRNCMTEYGIERLEPGDVVICNDPYRTGTHVNDLAFIRPIFFEGKIVSFVSMRAHQLDMGGVVPAGFSGSKRNVYETGLSIPPTLLYSRDKPVKSAFNLIFDNCRFGALLLPDIKTLYQSLVLGDRLYTVEQMLNNIDPATEAIEADVPVVLLRKEYAADTAGPGANRGGAAVIKDTLWLTEAEHWSMPLHTKTSTGFGVHGGRDGQLQASWMFPPEAFDVIGKRDLLPVDPSIYAKSVPVAGMLNPETQCLDAAGEYFYFNSTPVWKTRANSMFRYQTCGGGGWGNPLDRDPERVKRDVRDEYVSIEGAHRDYGVVIKGDPLKDPEGLVVDAAATVARRKEMMGAR